MRSKLFLGLTFILLISFCLAPVSAYACEYGHSSSYLRNGCSNINAYVEEVACSHAGEHYGGVDHSLSCQEHRTYKYEKMYCSYPGCTYSVVLYNVTHLCSVYHTGAFLVTSPCPY